MRAFTRRDAIHVLDQVTLTFVNIRVCLNCDDYYKCETRVKFNVPVPTGGFKGGGGRTRRAPP